MIMTLVGRAETFVESDITYSALANDLKNKARFDGLRDQVFHPSALILGMEHHGR